MSKLVHSVIERPRAWLALFGAVTLLLGAGMARLELRTDGATLRPPGDAVVVLTEMDRLRFQEPRQVILLVKSRPERDPVASPAGFRFLVSLVAELRTLPAVRASSILSLPDLPKPRTEGGVLELATMLDDVPDDPAAFASLVAELRSRRITDGLLLSPDGRVAALYVPLVEDRRVLPMIVEIEAWLAHHSDDPFALELTGPEVAEATLGHMVLRDLAVFVPVMLTVIVAVLWAVLRSFGYVLVPMAEALAVLVWTLGAMGWAGVPVTLVTTILPVVLMAMSITDEIHLLERVQALARPPHALALPQAVEHALGELTRPLVATAVTTAVGFASFASASMAPVRQFGVFAAFGIVAAMVLSFLWVPALMTALPRSWFSVSPRARPHGREPALPQWAARSPRVASTAGIAAIALAAPGIWLLNVQDSWVDNFAADAPLVRAARDYDRAFWGSYRFDVVLDAADDFFYSPAGVRLVEEVARVGAGGPNVNGVMSYLDVLEESAVALGDQRPLARANVVEIADLATVAEMSEQRALLRQLVTEGGDAARIRLFVRDADYERTAALAEYLEGTLLSTLARERHAVRHHFSGDLPAALTVVDAVVRNQLGSIAWTLPTVALVVFVLFRRGVDTLICVVPVAASIVLILGGMGYAGMPLGIATSMFASLAIGVGVDFAIHVLERYRRERRAGNAHGEAVLATADKAGRSIAWNATVLAAGFFVLNLSSLKPNHSLGILLASAMLVCYAATFMLLPRLLRFVAPALLLSLWLIAPPLARADDESRCRDFKADPAATELMRKLEETSRSRPRIVRMHIHTSYVESHPLHEYAKSHPLEKTLWGVSNGDSRETWMLYTFSGPGRLAGTSLLIQDFADASAADGMWFYLRSFDRFTKVDPKGQRVTVPGTGLTYEDARGFIATSKYNFAFAKQPDEATGEASVLGCPIDAQVRENVGYDSLLVDVDTKNTFVRRVEYAALGGKPLKSYRVVADEDVGGERQAKEVRTEHHTDGYFTRITYEHWPLKERPSAELFAPDVSREKFLARFERLLTEAGLGARIRGEIDASNAQLNERSAQAEPSESGAN